MRCQTQFGRKARRACGPRSCAVRSPAAKRHTGELWAIYRALHAPVAPGAHRRSDVSPRGNTSKAEGALPAGNAARIGIGGPAPSSPPAGAPAGAFLETRLSGVPEGLKKRPRKRKKPARGRLFRGSAGAYFSVRMYLIIVLMSASETAGFGGIGTWPQAPLPPFFTFSASIFSASALPAYFFATSL